MTNSPMVPFSVIYQLDGQFYQQLHVRVNYRWKSVLEVFFNFLPLKVLHTGVQNIEDWHIYFRVVGIDQFLYQSKNAF